MDPLSKTSFEVALNRKSDVRFQSSFAKEIGISLLYFDDS